jgi:hypothetical protein
MQLSPEQNPVFLLLPLFSRAWVLDQRWLLETGSCKKQKIEEKSVRSRLIITGFAQAFSSIFFAFFS